MPLIIFISHALFFLALAGTGACAAPFRIMLDPAGTQKQGRVINNIQEKTITLNCAEQLKKEIEEAIPNCTVILTRTAGQATRNQAAHTPAQASNHAQRANSSQIDLFLSLNFYQETDTKPHLYLYQFLYSTDNLFNASANKAKPSPFTFYKEEQSYLFNHASSEKAAHVIQQIANQKQYASLCTTHTVIACPCAQLKGIIVPALVLDMGIAKNTDWQLAIKPLVNTLVESIKIIAQI
jgi:N-acetylmuramoyl-L-alanine amidase